MPVVGSIRAAALAEGTPSLVVSSFESQLRVVLRPMEEQRDPPRQLG
jgi:hypothetical protein